MADELQRREEALRQANTGLEQRVEERTQELQSKNEELSWTLKQLRDTQKQLVAQEKLASLGSLTAGIAHELKNPLNFVNNFAQLSSGLADELTESLQSQRPRMEPAASAEVDEVLGELRRNMSKIWEHGNRANQIINAMLLHSRESSGRKEPAELNTVI
jgi:signal transduction histidine kinase